MDFTVVLLAIAVIAANILGVGMLVPQARRILRHRTLEGVSPEWIGIGVAANAGWLIYASMAEVWGLLGVATGGLAVYLAMAIGVRRLDPVHFDRIRTTTLVIFNVLGWAAAVGRLDALGLALAAVATVQFAPAVWSAWTSPTITGVSAATWVLALAEAAIWAGYGIAIGDQALTLSGAGAAVMSTLVLLRLGRGTRRDRAAQPAVGSIT